jgi:hypothetical protein
VTSAAYVNYSFVAGFVTGDYSSAYEFGRVGIALAERFAKEIDTRARPSGFPVRADSVALGLWLSFDFALRAVARFAALTMTAGGAALMRRR